MNQNFIEKNIQLMSLNSYHHSEPFLNASFIPSDQLILVPLINTFIVMVINANWSLTAYILSDLRMSLITGIFVYANGVFIIFKVKRELVSLPTES